MKRLLDQVAVVTGGGTGIGRGHIINISSESGLSYYTGDAVYGVSKHALNDLGEFVQRENQELNIRVNTICPGYE